MGYELWAHTGQKHVILANAGELHSSRHPKSSWPIAHSP